MAKPKNKYCETCEYLDSNMYYFEDTAYGCLLYGIKLFLHNNKPVRCTECIEREGKQ